MELSSEAKLWLLSLARQALEHFFETKDFLPYDNLSIPAEIKEELLIPMSAFVVLEMHQNQHRKAYIRGVNGIFENNFPIGKLISQIAINAGFFDPRAPRLKPYELNEMTIHILFPKEKVLLGSDYATTVSTLENKKEGIIVESRGRMAYALPYMWTDTPDAEKMLRMLRLQLGLKKTFNETQVDYFTFAVEEISEN